MKWHERLIIGFFGMFSRCRYCKGACCKSECVCEDPAMDINEIVEPPAMPHAVVRDI